MEKKNERRKAAKVLRDYNEWRVIREGTYEERREIAAEILSTYFMNRGSAATSESKGG